MATVVEVDFKDLKDFSRKYEWFRRKGAPAVASGVLSRLAKSARFDYIPEAWSEAVTVRKKTFLKSHLKYTIAKGQSMRDMHSAAGIMANKSRSQNFAEIETGGGNTGSLWMQIAARIGGDNARRVSQKYKDIIAKAKGEERPGWQVLFRDKNRTLLVSENGALIEIKGLRGNKRRMRNSVTTSPAERAAYKKKHYPFTALTSGTGFKMNKRRQFVKKAGEETVKLKLRYFYNLEFKRVVLQFHKK